MVGSQRKTPEQKPAPGRAACLCALLALAAILTAGSADAGSFHFGETRYFPTRYSEPRIVTDRHGNKTIVPPVPTEFEERHLGVGGETSKIRVSGRETIVIRRPSVKLRLKDSGHTIIVREGEMFESRGNRYRLLNVGSDGIEFKCVDTGRILRKRR
jgi:hypothetical protein